MKRDILGRYERTAAGEVIIDVSVRSVEDLFNNFDRAAAYRKKDLDQDFVDYLIECVTEIKTTPFIIRITPEEPEDPERMARTRRSIKNFFKYLKDLEYRDISRLLKKTGLYFCLGAVLITLTLLQAEPHAEPDVLRNLIREGTTIAAWVSLWQVFAQLIFELPPHFQNITRHQRIISSRVVFQEER